MSHDHLDDYIITLKLDATPEEKDRFLNDLAHAIVALTRHLLEREQDLFSDREKGEEREEHRCAVPPPE